MQPIQWLDIVNKIALFLGVGALIYIGKKLYLLENLKQTTETIKWNVKIITDSLAKSKVKHFDPSELKNYSPLMLTDAGIELLKKLGFPEIFMQYKPQFYNIIDSENPKLKYDVELAAIKSIIALSDESFMNPLKVFLYNTPQRTLDNTAPTLGVYVRDKYLKEHPEITE